MPWEITVSDRISSWGASGRIFQPGVYITDDVLIAEAAEDSEFVSAKLVSDGEEKPDAEFESESDPSGKLDRSNIAKPEADPLDCPLACGAPKFKTAKTRQAHIDRDHPQYVEPEPEPEAPPPPSPYVSANIEGEDIEGAGEDD